MAAKNERIYQEELALGIKRTDKYRIISANSLEELVKEVNRLANQGRWDIVSGAFVDVNNMWYQTMAKLPEEKIARMSLA